MTIQERINSASTVQDLIDLMIELKSSYDRLQYKKHLDFLKQSLRYRVKPRFEYPSEFLPIRNTMITASYGLSNEIEETIVESLVVARLSDSRPALW